MKNDDTIYYVDYAVYGDTDDSDNDDYDDDDAYEIFHEMGWVDVILKSSTNEEICNVRMSSKRNEDLKETFLMLADILLV